LFEVVLNIQLLYKIYKNFSHIAGAFSSGLASADFRSATTDEAAAASTAEESLSPAWEKEVKAIPRTAANNRAPLCI
jgi:hypothetical protein